jgi:hypothetical protein
VGERKVRLINGLEIGMFGAEFEIDQMMPIRLHNAMYLSAWGSSITS